MPMPRRRRRCKRSRCARCRPPRAEEVAVLFLSRSSRGPEQTGLLRRSQLPEAQLPRHHCTRWPRSRSAAPSLHRRPSRRRNPSRGQSGPTREVVALPLLPIPLTRPRHRKSSLHRSQGRQGTTDRIESRRELQNWEPLRSCSPPHPHHPAQTAVRRLWWKGPVRRPSRSPQHRNR